MTTQPKTAIVILNWNGGDNTIACLDSLAAEGYLGLPVLVVDNGSTDDSPARIEEKFPAVEILRLEANLGFTGGCNRGLEWGLARKADWVCLLNNDTVVTKGFLETLLEAVEKFPGVGIAAPRVSYYEPPGKIWSQGIFVNRWTGRILTPDCGKETSGPGPEPFACQAVSGAAILISRKLVEAIGYFDDDYFLCFEDVDLCLRARERGFSVLAVPRALVLHKVSASMGGEGSEAIIYFSARNQLSLINLRFPFPFPLGEARSLFIIVWTLLFAVITSPAPFRRSLRAWTGGVRDYLLGRMGKPAEGRRP